LALSALGAEARDEAVFKEVKQYLQQGDKTEDVKVTLTIGAESLTVTRGATDATVIPFTAITGATYDRRVRQRKAMGLPTGGLMMIGSAPKLQHFLTVQFKVGTSGDFVELELGKDIASRVVATMEARSGLTIEKH
jgi:hypothetical protein